jgi:hypothetical protein
MRAVAVALISIAIGVTASCERYGDNLCERRDHDWEVGERFHECCNTCWCEEGGRVTCTLVFCGACGACAASGACPFGVECGDVCCASGEQCVDGACSCGGGPACAEGSTCTVDGDPRIGDCGNTCTPA